MKDKDNNILDRIGRCDGMTVPEGFFEDFARRMQAELPENPDAENTRVLAPKTFWERVRPFVYMAATVRRHMVYAEDVHSHEHLSRRSFDR